MNQSQLLLEIKNILQDKCEIPVEKVHLQAKLQDDLELDSMGLLTLAVEIENHYQIRLEESVEHPIDTVQDVMNLLSLRLSEKESLS